MHYVVFANILQPLIDVLKPVLDFYHDHLGVSWGLAIIMLTVSVRLVLLPLTLRQVRSMQRMQMLAPEIRAIQARYKADRQRQQQEMMKFYQENRVNPLASCFPLLFQLPFFIALYYMLRTDLRHEICGQTARACSQIPGFEHSAKFLFIPDITQKATGATLVVLVVLYVASQLGSGLLSSASMDRNQRMIMLFLPVVFVFFVIRFPAGLMVYWITTNCWTIAQQLVVRKTIGPVRPVTATAGARAAVPARATSGGGSGGGASGSGSGGGLSGLLRGLGGGGGASARREPAPAARSTAPAAPGNRGRAGRASTSRASTERPASNGAEPRSDRSGPPPSARRRKKRSGRRR